MTHIRECTPEELAALLPHPAPDTNKYARGKLVFVGGCAAYPGAAILACTAAQRMGAGYVEAFCAHSSVPLVQSARPSLVVRAWEACSREKISTSDGHPVACLVGSGMDASDDAQASLVREIAAGAHAPLVIDGGALGVIAASEGIALCRERADRGDATILTPHGGEARRLATHAGIGAPAGASPVDLARFAEALSAAYCATVLLKGPDSYIASVEAVDRASEGEAGQSAVIGMRTGTAALAKAGTGDVLAGMVGALCAQGLHAVEACALGATLHAEAGRAAQARLGDISVCAEDVLASIPDAIRFL